MQLTQILLVYPSAEIAEARMNAVFDVSMRSLSPGDSVKRSEIQNSSRERIGQVLDIKEGQKGHVYWNNRKLLTFVSGLSPHPLRYHEACSY